MKEAIIIHEQVILALTTNSLFEFLLLTIMRKDRVIENCIHLCFLLNTGIFTAPLDGRYFFSAILTGHKNEKIEAVLSRSNYGMARVDSAGYQPEGLENKPMAEAKPTPGSLAVFNIILPLQVGDTVCIDLVMGKLAHSVEPLTIFSGMLLYEDV